jgi:hypothetical protein
MRAKFRRHWVALTVGVVLAGLTVNAWVQAGSAAILVLALAAVGCAIVLVSIARTTDALVVQHVADPKRQVEAQRVRIQIEAAEGKR